MDLHIHILTFIKQSSQQEARQLACDKLELTWICTQVLQGLNGLESFSISPNHSYPPQDLSLWRTGRLLNTTHVYGGLAESTYSDLTTTLINRFTHIKGTMRPATCHVMQLKLKKINMKIELISYDELRRQLWKISFRSTESIPLKRAKKSEQYELDQIPTNLKEALRKNNKRPMGLDALLI